MTDQPHPPRASAASSRGAGFREQKYRDSSGSEHDHYQCNDCPFDSFDKDTIVAHQGVAHQR